METLEQVLRLEYLEGYTGADATVYAMMTEGKFKLESEAYLTSRVAPEGFQAFGGLDYCLSLAEAFDDKPADIIGYVNELNGHWK